MNAFPDVKPFPTAPAPAQAGMGHNRIPFDEQAVLDFEEAMLESGLKKRVADLVGSAGRVGECADAETAGKIGDLAKMCRAAAQAIEAEREKVNRPILTAQRALKGKADGYVGQLDEAMRPVKATLESFMAEERRRADEARRKAEEDARAIAEAERARLQAELDARAAESGDEPEFAEVAPFVAPAPVEVEAPVVRGDYGSRIGSKTVWHHEIESVRKLPDHVLNHEKVKAAISQVVGQMVRGGTRELKGARIWSTQETNIR